MRGRLVKKPAEKYERKRKRKREQKAKHTDKWWWWWRHSLCKNTFFGPVKSGRYILITFKCKDSKVKNLKVRPGSQVTLHWKRVPGTHHHFTNIFLSVEREREKEKENKRKRERERETFCPVIKVEACDLNFLQSGLHFVSLDWKCSLRHSAQMAEDPKRGKLTKSRWKKNVT